MRGILTLLSTTILFALLDNPPLVLTFFPLISNDRELEHATLFFETFFFGVSHFQLHKIACKVSRRITQQCYYNIRVAWKIKFCSALKRTQANYKHADRYLREDKNR
jgi:hypothetical protein